MAAPREELWSELARFDLGPDVIIPPVDVRISDHAMDRFRERIERVPRTQVIRRLEQLLDTSAWRGRPLPSTTFTLHDRSLYGYPSRRPDVCLVVRDGWLITVLPGRQHPGRPRVWR